MYQVVFLQVSQLRKALAAHLACEGSLAAVCAQVDLEVTQLAERFPALVALVVYFAVFLVERERQRAYTSRLAGPGRRRRRRRRSLAAERGRRRRQRPGRAALGRRVAAVGRSRGPSPLQGRRTQSRIGSVSVEGPRRETDAAGGRRGALGGQRHRHQRRRTVGWWRHQLAGRRLATASRLILRADVVHLGYLDFDLVELVARRVASERRSWTAGWRCQLQSGPRRRTVTVTGPTRPLRRPAAVEHEAAVGVVITAGTLSGGVGETVAAGAALVRAATRRARQRGAGAARARSRRQLRLRRPRPRAGLAGPRLDRPRPLVPTV